MSKSRTKNSIINILAGVGYQVFILIFNFISRTLFIRILGIEYLGINGLFTNILSVLSLADLGLATAMVYSMYKPLADNDETKLAALTNYYKIMYNRIALFVLLAGLAVIPFLSYIINLENSIKHVTLYYILFLVNSVSSYLFVYKTSILTADQKAYKLKIYNTIGTVLRFLLQIIVLMVFKSYILYVVVQVISDIAINAYSAHKATKICPYINQSVSLDECEKNNIWANIKSMFSYKLGGVILNNTDQLLISILVSTEVVGLFSNYKIVITAITGITSMFFISIQASVGNLATVKGKKQIYEIFNILDMCSFWIYGFCTICLCLLSQDFVTLWLGKEFLLDNKVMYIAAFTYYLTGILYPIWDFRETVGLFKHTKHIMFFAAAVNLILSILWGNIWGISGILLATVFARLMTNVWYEPYKLFTLFFEENVIKYYLKQIIHATILIAIILVLNRLFAMMFSSITVFTFIVKMVICIVGINLFFIVIMCRTAEFKSLKKMIRKVIVK